MSDNTQNWRNLEEDEEEDEGGEDFGYGGRDGILFLVDCAKSMFEEENSKFSVVMECLETVLMNRIIMSESDLIGVVFYNTEKSPEISSEVNVPNPKNSAIFLPFGSQSASNIQTIIDFRRSEDFDDFESKFGHSDQCSLSEIFWFCSRTFLRCGYKLRASSIVLFTDNPQPYTKGSHEEKQMFLRAKDLQDLEVNVTLVPMDETFDGDLFYKQFLCLVLNEELDAFEMPTFDGNIQKLTKRIYRRDYRKKANSTIEFSLSKDVKFGVAIFSMSRKTKYPASALLDRKTNQVITKKRVYNEVSEEGTGKILLPGDQCKSIEFGGEKIIFTSDEHTRVKTIIPKGFKLLGFKPANVISVYKFVTPCLFLFPEESKILGSTKLFRVLWERCLERNKVAIGVLIQKFKSLPTYVALVPQETCVLNDEIVRNNGFRIIFLPYKDDIRELDVFQKDPKDVEEDEKELFKKLIKKIKFKYNPSFFENPVIQKIYSNIESIVYKADEVDFEDSTMRHLEQQAGKTADICREIIEKFGEIAIEFAKKRPAASSASTQAAKKAKSATGDLKTDVENTFLAGNENSLTVAELKAYLSNRGVTGLSSARKGDLISKIKEILD